MLLSISAFLLLPNLGFPRAIIFDETYFIPTTQRYLNGIFFQEPHPPLAKLLIAFGQAWMHPESTASDFVGVEQINRSWSPDEDITGYRVMSALFGVLIPIPLFLLLAMMLRRDLLALALALFVTFDNALIVQSRAALQDSFLIFFMLCAILFYVGLAREQTPWSRRRQVLLMALWGVMAGCAASVKLTGLFVLVLVAWYGLRLLYARRIRRAIVLGLVFTSAFAFTFFGIWQIHFSMARQLGASDYGITDAHRRILLGIDTPDPLTRFAVQMQDALAYQQRYEAGVPQLDLAKPDEIGSPWYWWLAGGRAMNYRWETPDGGAYRYIYLLGNPITWLASLIGVVLGTLLMLTDLPLRFLRAEQRQWLVPFVLLYWAYMLPMMAITRVMYLYHYLPPLVAGLILFGIVLACTPRRLPHLQRNVMVVALIALGFMFWVYKPLTYYEPLTPVEFQQRDIWPLWHLQCVGC